MAKVLPYSRTVVLKLLVETADSISRLPVAKGSMGIRVTEGMEYSVSDTVLTDQALEITGIAGGLALISTQNFLVSITVGGVTGPEIQCTGLFSFSGAADKVVVKRALAGTPLRLKYVKA